MIPFAKVSASCWSATEPVSIHGAIATRSRTKSKPFSTATATRRAFSACCVAIGIRERSAPLGATERFTPL